MFSSELTNFSEDISGAFGSLETNTKEKCDEIVASVTRHLQSSITDFLTAHLGNVAGIRKQVNKHVTDQRATVCSQRASITASATARREEMSTFRTRNLKQHEENKSTVTTCLERVQENLTTLSKEELGNVSSTLKNGERDVLEVISTNGERYKERTQQLDSMNHEFKENMGTRLRKAASFEETQKSACDRLVEFGRQLTSEQNQWGQSIHRAEEAIDTHRQKMNGHGCALSDGIHQIALNTVKHTNRTPKRRAVRATGPPSRSSNPAQDSPNHVGSRFNDTETSVMKLKEMHSDPTDVDFASNCVEVLD